MPECGQVPRYAREEGPEGKKERETINKEKNLFTQSTTQNFDVAGDTDWRMAAAVWAWTLLTRLTISVTPIKSDPTPLSTYKSDRCLHNPM